MSEWDNYCDEIGGVCKDMEAQDARIAELEKMAEARKLANRLLEQERNELEAECVRMRKALQGLMQSVDGCLTPSEALLWKKCEEALKGAGE